MSSESTSMIAPRTAEVIRSTTETKIELHLVVEGRGEYKISTGIRFFDHMLELFTRHGGFDLELTCRGDLDVDQHHTVEDVGIALGEAFARAIGDKRGINRAGYFIMPMDETLAIAAVDLSGRTAYAVDTKVRTRLVGDLQTELVTDFFEGFRPWCSGQCSCEDNVRPQQPSQDRSYLQSVCAGFASGLFARQAVSRSLAVDQGVALMADIRAAAVTVIDYKAGNLTSVVKALRHLGAEVTVTDRAEDLIDAERIVLPGVGHFSATKLLDETGMTRAISAAIAHGVPFLGICVGMQWLLSGSTEAPEQPGLGYFQGRCDRFPEGSEKVPHVGWNQITARSEPASRLFAGVQDNSYVYFTHSYRVPTTVDVRTDDGSLANPTAAVTQYIQPFASAVEHGNVFGVQFHPEKSGDTGLKILTNFLEIPSC